MPAAGADAAPLEGRRRVDRRATLERLGPGEAGGETLSGLEVKAALHARSTRRGRRAPTSSSSGSPARRRSPAACCPGHVPGAALGHGPVLGRRERRRRPTCGSGRCSPKASADSRSRSTSHPERPRLRPPARARARSVGSASRSTRLADMETMLDGDPARRGRPDPHDGQRHRADRRRPVHRRRRVARLSARTASASCCRTTS